MKTLIRVLLAAILVALPVSASITDSTYSVTPPVTGSQCPANQPGQAYPCYYLALGRFMDTYQFTVTDAGTYSFEVTGNHWRRCTVSGRGTACYTESMTILEADVLDADGMLVLTLANTAVDDWTGSVQLPPGDYSLGILGDVGGNRPGVYGYGITPVATPP